MGHWRSGPPPGGQPQEVKSQWFSIRDDPISIIKKASWMWLIHLRGLKEAQLLYFLSTQDYHDLDDLDDWNLHEFTCFSCACVGFLWALGKLLLLNWPQLLVCGCLSFCGSPCDLSTLYSASCSVSTKRGFISTATPIGEAVKKMHGWMRSSTALACLTVIWVFLCWQNLVLSCWMS